MNTSSPRPPDLNPGQRQRLAEIFAPADLALDPASRWSYGYDNSRRQAMPQAVAFAREAAQVQALVRFCADEGLPLVARGRGTGTTGATVPDRGGVVLSFERMGRIIEIAPADRLAVVEPGLTNAALQRALAPQGLFWPPDPTSAAACTLGGNLAYNSAGPHAVKYGTPRENTLGLEAVTGTGELIRTGVRTTKGVVGYDLTRLLIGSEGTLALITRATLRLHPLPEARRGLRAAYGDVAAAAAAVAAIMGQAAIPSALEFMDRAALGLVREAGVALPEAAGALLLLEVDGPRGCIDNAVEAVAAAARVDGLVELLAPDDMEALWAARRALSPALRRIAPKKINEDVAVPVSQLPALVSALEALGEAHGIRIVNFGHAGNGNLHVNLLIDPDRPGEAERARACLGAVFDQVLALGGTLSGEHGVGLEKRDYVGREIAAPSLALMRGLKQVFDPRGILNPGKGLPEG